MADRGYSRKVMDYLQEHAGDMVTIETAARSLGLETSQVSQILSGFVADDIGLTRVKQGVYLFTPPAAVQVTLARTAGAPIRSLRHNLTPPTPPDLPTKYVAPKPIPVPAPHPSDKPKGAVFAQGDVQLIECIGHDDRGRSLVRLEDGRIVRVTTL